MKKHLIAQLRSFKDRISALKKDVSKLKTTQVSRKAIRDEAEAIADIWVEELRSPLEHRFKLPIATIEKMSEDMKRLHVLSRPNNQKSSYTRCLNSILKNFDDGLILPLQQAGGEPNSVPALRPLFSGLADADLGDYLEEAIDCAERGFYKAAIVLGWCAAIDLMQKKILSIGLSTFNKASTKIKNKTNGKYKRWNKEFSIGTLPELQTVFDTDLIIVLEGMELLDGNQSQRLETCFQYRNHSAHPGEAPIEPAHVISFFTDIQKIVICNDKFSLL